MKYIGKILPVDGFTVQLDHSLPTDYMNALVHLYQPLLGLEAIGLYLTLLHDLDIQTDNEPQTHHTLMNHLNMPLDKIYEARMKLEAIGLMETYYQELEHGDVYHYHLQVPFRPVEFFQDVMLSELLYYHVGQSKFNRLRAFYAPVKRKKDGKNMTVSFNDVFQTVEPTQEQTVSLSERKKSETDIPLNVLDFTPLEQALKKLMIDSKKVLTKQNKRIITQLMTLYDLEFYEMEKSIQWALTDEHHLDIPQLKAACHDLFRKKHNVSRPALSVKENESTELQSPVQAQQLSQEDRLIQTLETISPKQLLEDLSSGNNASEQDMKMISDIMVSQGLPTPVMNVLIHYVLLQSNMNLSKPYMTKIASHWSRKGLKTAKEAMAFARNEIKERTKPRRNYRQQKKEIIPDWFKEQATQNKQERVNTKETLSVEEEKEKAEMLALLQRHANK